MPSHVKKYIAQFYIHNKIPFFFAIIACLSVAFINLLLSWLLQQIIDTVTTATSMKELIPLVYATALMIIAIIVGKMLAYYTRPHFIMTAMKQYKAYAFHKLMQKKHCIF